MVVVIGVEPTVVVLVIVLAVMLGSVHQELLTLQRLDLKTVVVGQLNLIDYLKLVVQVVELDQSLVVITVLVMLLGSCRLLVETLLIEHLLFHHQMHQNE